MSAFITARRCQRCLLWVASRRSELYHFNGSYRAQSRHFARVTSIGGAEEDRTPDLRIANATLSQLSYGPTRNK